MSQKVSAYLELTAAMTIVGSSVIVGKVMTERFPIFLVSTLRLGIGLPVLLLLTRNIRDELRKLRLKDYAVLFLQAFTGIFLFNALLLYALNFTTAADSGIITSMTPAVIGLISWLFLGERLSPKAGGGIVLTVCGILVINVVKTPTSAAHSTAPLMGNLLVVGAVVGEALFTIFRRVTAGRISSLLSATLVTIFGLLIFLPMGVYEAATFDFTIMSPADVLGLLYYGVGVTAVAYILWFSGVEKVSASAAAVFTGVLPISTVILSVLILGEPGTAAHLAGLACVLGGIYLITRPVT